MIDNIIESLVKSLNVFDTSVAFIFFYCIVQCFIKGFSLSLISFMKWVISTVVTIILVPKFQPFVNEYIESEFINSVGLGVAIFLFVASIFFVSKKIAYFHL